MTSEQLRILSVVTLVTPLGEYGGPVRVAVNQAKALRDLGHDVVLAGAARGFGNDVPVDLEGVPAVLRPSMTAIPRTGFAGLSSPGLWWWVRRNLASFDVVHVHVARDFITLPVANLARKRGIPYVLQPHGMIAPTRHPLAKPLDARWTGPVLRQAQRVFYLSRPEKKGLIEVGGTQLKLRSLPNGVPDHQGAAHQEAVTVLYLARFASRKRPRFFVELARRLAPGHPEARFVMVGPDEGEGAAVRRDIADARSSGVPIEWKGALPPAETLAEMKRASVYVLPSVNEPNGMSVLEAMSVGLPVVVTDTCGLADMIEEAGAGLIVDDSIEDLEKAVDRLLADPEKSAHMGAMGRDYVRTHLSMSAIARQLELAYRGLD